MSLLDYLQNENTILNSKGGRYYSTTYDANLDFFAGVSRYQTEEDIIRKFDNALAENETLALANLLLLLDIRGGKGERRLFKIGFKYLCDNNKELALKILPLIPELGRWDYVLVGIDTQINDEVLKMIKNQYFKDLNSENPSLLAKWLPSHRNHGVNNPLAKKIYTYLGLTEKQYRKQLKELRNKLKIVEHNLTNKDYEINFESVPTKAMLKYRDAFERLCEDRYSSYLKSVAKGEKKINTKGLYCYEIINKIFDKWNLDETEILLFDNMWNNQKDFLEGNDTNLLVMADTSGSMTYPSSLPIANSIGLALYIAERNKGFFHNYFLTFSSEPTLQKVNGTNIYKKVHNIEEHIENTDIDRAFKLILDTAVKNNLPQEEMPTHIIIISDMEFDEGCYCTGEIPSDLDIESEEDVYWWDKNPSENNTTNLEGWKKAFKEENYTLPKIIFWNVAVNTHGLPATKQDNDVAMVAGFSPYILENILEPNNMNPVEAMVGTLQKYLNILNEQRT